MRIGNSAGMVYGQIEVNDLTVVEDIFVSL